MGDVYREACFSQKDVYKWAKYGFATMSLILKDSETHWISGDKKVPGTAVSKEVDADSLQERGRTHHYWFPWKKYNCKQCFLLPTPKTKFILFNE